MTTTAMPEHAQCICGKLSFTQNEANDVVRRALVSRVLHRNARRAEQRSYPCDVNPGVWHVTSRKDMRPLERPDGSLIVDYGTADDVEAMSVITKVLMIGRDDHWLTLINPERVKQTRRVLARIRTEFNDLANSKKSELELEKSRYKLGEINDWELYRIKQEYFAWVDQIKPFRAELTHRQNQVKDADTDFSAQKRGRNIAAQAEKEAQAQARAQERDEARAIRAADYCHQQNYLHRAAVQELTFAIQAHREATPDPTATDFALWSSLDTVSIPHGSGTTTLSELLDQGAWKA